MLRSDPKPEYKKKRNKERNAAIYERKKQHLEDMAFYHRIARERKALCENPDCKDPRIPYGITPLNIDHILEKSKERYARLRYEPGNIQILCWSCHTNKTNGNKNDWMKEQERKTKELFNVL